MSEQVSVRNFAAFSLTMDLSNRLAAMNIDKATRSDLRELRSLVREHIDAAITAAYDQILQFPDVKPHRSSPCRTRRRMPSRRSRALVPTSARSAKSQRRSPRQWKGSEARLSKSARRCKGWPTAAASPTAAWRRWQVPPSKPVPQQRVVIGADALKRESNTLSAQVDQFLAKIRRAA